MVPLQPIPDHGKPGLWPTDRACDFGAFVIARDGNSIEAVYHRPQ